MTDRDPQTDAAERRARLFWPGLVLALLGGQVLFTVVTVYLATMDNSFAVEPDYYQKALHWDGEIAQRRENARLGWTAALEVGDDVSVFDERTLTCRLADAEGRPVEGAAVDLVAFPHSRGSQRASAVLVEADAGAYVATLRFRRKGVWEFRIAARQGPNVFTYRETRDVYPPGESRPWRP